MGVQDNGKDESDRSPVSTANREIVAGGIVVATIFLFVANGSAVLPSIGQLISGTGANADTVLATTLILNIALLLFGWRRYVDLSREVRERTEAEARVRALAYSDTLTGLPNRRAFLEIGAETIEKAAKRGKSVAVLLLDLDHFKTVNDVNGHAAGDAVLGVASAIIAASLPTDAIAARLGGDEFACAIPFDSAAPEVVDLVAEGIVARLSRPLDAKGINAHISVSVGIARTEPDCETIEALIRRADIAMYVSKNQGRSRYNWFDGSMERELQTRNAIELGMRDGIPQGQFVPYYEQQIDLTTGRLHGFEILARWIHPTRGIIPPDIFIPIAEETGMIGDLSLSVMRQAFMEAKSWDRSLMLSVNISPMQLKDPWLAQKIVKLLIETGFPAQRLEVEITESSLFENLGLAQSIVGSLKNQGIHIALDDFGTGYSSLAHLRALPFDRIKIDRSFVSSINENSESAAIVNAITRLGESLNLPITAEGIEDSVIEARLRELGCSKGQGWLFGKPMDLPSVRALLANRGLLPTAREPAPVAPIAKARQRKAG
ncbi:MAG: GGDEF-domain containing protein [Sphingomonas sanxanigenens]|uniref:GGDEF-domain containing protein n=1 Tax=Sphingomonas sanxanigenens TaxID=397260 RepID=A0A2W4ZWW7_9SPHN|nr:MAG: GGDEF-domain containing protein [Sphingomonas sanxanigenens]